MRITRKLGAVLATAAMAASLAGCGAGKETLDLAAYRTQADGFSFTNYPGETVYAAQPQEEYAALLDGYEAVCESRFLTLYADKARAAVAVSDRRHRGRVWILQPRRLSTKTRKSTRTPATCFTPSCWWNIWTARTSNRSTATTPPSPRGLSICRRIRTGLTVTYHLMDNKTADTDGPEGRAVHHHPALRAGG